MMYGCGKSDSLIVPEKSPNETAKAAEEVTEGRGLAKGNQLEGNTFRTQSRTDVPSALERIREAAAKDKILRFTALFHHVYEVERLRKAYFSVKHDAAPGVDGETWRQYGENLEHNIQDLAGRLRRGAYRTKPVRRVYIPKADGRQRPIGLPTLEDKIVQRAVVEVLNAIYERDFLGFSYGFRPGRQQHHALDALWVAIQSRKISWILDADIRAFFDTLSHEWLVKFIEHRIADQRIVRLIRKWLKAGVLEEGRRTQSEVGTVQGGSISPLLSNIYLHYAFDLWGQWWRTKQARGEVIVVRFADDFIVGFQYPEEARRFLDDLKERFARFELQLHPDKTRLIEFGRFAQENRLKRGQRKPEIFNFLGFTHICGRNKNGKFLVVRKTVRKKWQAKLKALRMEMRRRMHDPIPEQGAYLRSVVLGHNNYYGVPTNKVSMQAFRLAVSRMWFKILRRRSDKHILVWERMKRLIAKWIPPARICHPYPCDRFIVNT